MPNIPEPTPTETAFLPNAYNNLAAAAAPMPTAWTAPGSCAGNIPTVIHGACFTSGCTQSPASRFNSDLASGLLVNYPQYTRNTVVTPASCMPPGYLPLVGFVYTPAVGCPANWLTASTMSAASKQTYVVCCPS